MAKSNFAVFLSFLVVSGLTYLYFRPEPVISSSPNFSKQTAAQNNNNHPKEVWEEEEVVVVDENAVREKIRTGLDRHVGITGGRTEFTAQDCIRTSLTCGSACGEKREHRTLVCFCVRVHRRSVTYLRKEEGPRADDYGFHYNNSWTMDMFHNFMIALNKVQMAIHDSDLYFKEPIYMVLNVMDFPRLFSDLDTNYPEEFMAEYEKMVPKEAFPIMKRYPRITRGHHSETLPFEFFKNQAFEGGLPPFENLRPEFKCGTPKDHFPILSWSVNPVINFDILVPHAHRGDCLEQVFDQAIVEVPWENKTDTLMFRGSGPAREDAECNLLHSPHGQRGRLCGRVHGEKVQDFGKAHNIKIDMFDKESMHPAEQAKAKYLFMVDGAVAAFRSTWYLATGSVLFVAAAFEEVRSQFLVPFVHYIPVKPNFADLLDKLDMVVLDPAYAKWVGENARTVSKFLSLDPEGVNDGGFTFDKLYWEMVMREYSKRFHFTENRADLANFTEDRGCQKFEDSDQIRCFDGNKYACEDVLQDGFKYYSKKKFIPGSKWRNSKPKRKSPRHVN